MPRRRIKPESGSGRRLSNGLNALYTLLSKYGERQWGATMANDAEERWRLLRDALPLKRNPVVVDVGANPLEDPVYKPLMKKGFCNVVGFEPQESAYQELMDAKGPNETYLPAALGDGNPAKLNVYAGSGLSSTYTLSEKTRAFLGRSKRAARLLETVDVDLKRLDDVDEITHLDLLKIDVQGSEISIFNNGKRKLSDAVIVISEVRFY